MAHSPAFSRTASPLSFYFIRAFSYFFVLLSLIIHQILFSAFIDPNLSVFAYSLCFFALLADSCCLFFYKNNQKQPLFSLFFINALFLSALVAIMGLPGLFLAFFLIFAQTFSLLFLEKDLVSAVFLLSLSALLPIAFLWGERLSFHQRLSLSVFICLALLSIFCFSWLLRLLLQSFAGEEAEMAGSASKDFPDPKPLAHVGLSLELARKLKTALNSLRKYFPDSAVRKERSVPASFLPPRKGRRELESLRIFISDFIEYAEPETESLLDGLVDLNKLLKSLLKKLENHAQKPEDLIQKTKWPEPFKVKGSASHLEKCFEHILVNSFEALKNQEQPKIRIHGYFEKDWLALDFSDNGHGIESEDMKKIFYPFFSKRLGGLKGLGLPYIQKIIKAHQAALDIESSKQGTRVSIRFPLLSYDRPVGSQKKKAA